MVENDVSQILYAAGVACVAAIAPVQVPAQDTPGGLDVELNAATHSGGGCTLSFFIENDGGETIDRAVYETVIFGTDGQVERLTLLDFGELPVGRPRVRQFTLSDTPCDGIGRILFNGAETCEGGADGACTEGLTLSSRTGIEVIG